MIAVNAILYNQLISNLIGRFFFEEGKRGTETSESKNPSKDLFFLFQSSQLFKAYTKPPATQAIQFQLLSEDKIGH